MKCKSVEHQTTEPRALVHNYNYSLSEAFSQNDASIRPQIFIGYIWKIELPAKVEEKIFQVSSTPGLTTQSIPVLNLSISILSCKTSTETAYLLQKSWPLCPEKKCPVGHYAHKYIAQRLTLELLFCQSFHEWQNSSSIVKLWAIYLLDVILSKICFLQFLENFAWFLFTLKQQRCMAKQQWTKPYNLSDC